MFVSARTNSASLLKFTVSMIVLCSFVSSFQPIVNQGLLYNNHPVNTLSSNPSARTNTVLNVYGNKKSKKVSAEEAEKYWQGEWVCKDCGYIYNRAECAGMYFEEQGPGFRCPQCSGPRRRYAKKVGDRVGTTLDGGDAPILIFSFGGVLLTIAFGIWAVNNL